MHQPIVVPSLAEGGMGAVYLAEHERLANIRKVIKVLLPEYAANPVIRLRFEREAQAFAKLKHDNILTIDDFGTLADGQLFLMVPFLDGKPLDAYLRTRGARLGEHRTLHIVLQLCSALDHAHSAGIVHRDLKPGNVFVVPTDNNPYAIKLLDFGIAKIDGDDQVPHTKSGIAMGTPSYMAVEQYERAAEATHLADMYSTAIVTWEIVTGRLPWGHHAPAVLYFQQRTVIPERPTVAEMSSARADIPLAALRVDPATRPQSMRELAVALASATPAVGRLPSGAEILASVTSFIENAAPNAETVRNAASVDRVAPLLWPTRETDPGQPGLPPLNVVTSSNERPAGPTANARPPAVTPAGARPTTLSASSGSTSTPAPRTVPRWKLALAGLAACLGAALVTVVVASQRSSRTDSAPTGSSRPSARSDEPSSATAPDARPAPASAATNPVPADAGVLAPSVAPDASIVGAGRAPPPTDQNSASSPNDTGTKAPHRRSKTATVEGTVVPRVGSPRTPTEGTARGSADRPRSSTFDPNAIGGQ